MKTQGTRRVYLDAKEIKQALVEFALRQGVASGVGYSLTMRDDTRGTLAKISAIVDVFYGAPLDHPIEPPQPPPADS